MRRAYPRTAIILLSRWLTPETAVATGLESNPGGPMIVLRDGMPEALVK